MSDQRKDRTWKKIEDRMERMNEKIVILNGAAKKNGTTAAAIRAFREGAEEESERV